MNQLKEPRLRTKQNKSQFLNRLDSICLSPQMRLVASIFISAILFISTNVLTLVRWFQYTKHLISLEEQVHFSLENIHVTERWTNMYCQSFLLVLSPVWFWICLYFLDCGLSCLVHRVSTWGWQCWRVTEQNHLVNTHLKSGYDGYQIIIFLCSWVCSPAPSITQLLLSIRTRISSGGKTEQFHTEPSLWTCWCSTYSAHAQFGPVLPLAGSEACVGGLQPPTLTPHPPTQTSLNFLHAEVSFMVRESLKRDGEKNRLSLLLICISVLFFLCQQKTNKHFIAIFWKTDLEFVFYHCTDSCQEIFTFHKHHTRKHNASWESQWSVSCLFVFMMSVCVCVCFPLSLEGLRIFVFLLVYNTENYSVISTVNKRLL